MAQLSVSLFGSFQTVLNDTALSGFRSNKARSLLAYLVVEKEQAHPRLSLATMLWPESSERSALTSLRSTLVNLRKLVDRTKHGPPYFLVTRNTVQFNPYSDYWLDIAEFERLIRMWRSPAADSEVGEAQVGYLNQAIALRRGDFLEGFSVGDSNLFEDWLFQKRNKLNSMYLEALRQLALFYEHRGELEQAIPYLQKRIELEPWNEEGQQLLMRSLAQAGKRSAALSQYEACRRWLAKELGVEPSGETIALYEAIRDGKIRPFSGEQIPPDLKGQREEQVQARKILVVGRKREFERLGTALKEALAGQGQLIFVTGSPGSGKTVLIKTFVDRVLLSNPSLVVAFGTCNAYTGIGDPYLPFLQIMELLGGNTGAKYAGSPISTILANRLRTSLPIFIEAVSETGPDLVNRFIGGEELVQRALAVSKVQPIWLNRLERLVELEKAAQSTANMQQADLFEQYVKVVQFISSKQPIILVIDDLQWADIGSINLLFHLGRSLVNRRILVIGAYRPEEIAFGRGGDRHPLEPILHELQRLCGDISLNLDESDGMEFIEAFLDLEANRLDEAFRKTLFRHTAGHPLFTVELLRDLQDRGELVRDGEGQWIVGPDLHWGRMPARVEAVIAERIGRLTPDLRQILEAASVEGEEFTAEVQALALSTAEAQLIRQLSDPLERKHDLIAAQQFRRSGEQRISRYRFRHHLFQRYLYTFLNPVERAYWHEAIGQAIESFYREQPEELASMAVQLARHFQEAGITLKAITYLHMAGERAGRLSANQEGITHFRNALDLCLRLPDEDQRDHITLELLMGLGALITASTGYSSVEVEQVYAQAYELCLKRIQKSADAPGASAQLIPILFGLSSYYAIRAQYKTSIEIIDQIDSQARSAENPQWISIARWGYGWVLLHTGEFWTARSKLEKVIGVYNPQQYQWLQRVFWQDIGVSCLTWLSWALFLTGFPDQAYQRSDQAVRLARQINHPFTLAFSLVIASVLHSFADDVQGTLELADAAVTISSEKKFPFWLGTGMIWRGWALSRSGETQSGISQMQEGTQVLKSIGSKVAEPAQLGYLSDVLRDIGFLEESSNVLEDAISICEKSGEGFYAAELFRLKGDLLLKLSDETRAESWYRRAIEQARQQQARFWELRATNRLSRLLIDQGKRDEAHQLLNEIYGKFTEGFETREMVLAKSLLEESVASPASAPPA